MRKKKKACIQVLALTLAVTLCGCAGKTEEEGTDEITYIGFSPVRASSYNDRGVVYFGEGEQSGISFFYDPEKDMSAPLCARVNCTHDSGDCDANLGAESFVAYTGDALYYAHKTNGFRDTEICRADPDGTNRKVIRTIENSQINTVARIEGGYLVYAYYNQYDEEGNVYDEADAGICLLNLRTGELERLEMAKEYFQGKIIRVTIDKGCLYYYYFYSEKSLNDYSFEELSGMGPEERAKLMDLQKHELWKYDLTTKENTRLWQKAYDQIKLSALGYGHLYSETGYMENLSTGERDELPEELLSGMSPCIFDEGVLLTGDGEFFLWRFGTDELELIGTFDSANMFYEINCVTKKWVYLEKYERYGEKNNNLKPLGAFYAPREKFMKGEWR